MAGAPEETEVSEAGQAESEATQAEPEATPQHLRLRKRILGQTARKRAAQNRASQVVAE